MRGLYRRGRVWWFRYSVRGQGQQFESLGTEDEAIAIAMARDISENPERLTSRQWQAECDAYFAERVKAKRLSVNAAKSRGTILAAFAREMDITHPSQVTPALVARWYAALQKRVAEETAQSYIGNLKTFLAHLVDQRKLRRNPVELEMDRRKSVKRKPFCSKAQVRALLMACPDEELRFVLYCGFHAGLRREEICEARPEWFDLANGLLHVQRSDTWEPKDRDDRTIPLTEEFAAFLASYGLRKPFMIEPGKKAKGKWRYRYDFRRPFERLVASVGLEWVGIHTMRRTFASLKVSDGVSLYKVASWLGDLERIVQDHYGFLIPKDADIERGN